MSSPPLRFRILSATSDSPGSGKTYGTRGMDLRDVALTRSFREQREIPRILRTYLQGLLVSEEGTKGSFICRPVSDMLPGSPSCVKLS